jgi:hypothetical protein
MSGITAAYRIGPAPDLFLSDDLAADALTLDGQIKSLDNQDMTKVSASYFDGWNAFVSEWRRFYSSVFLNSFFGAGWNDSNRDQLIQFETRFGTFAEQWAQQTAQVLPGGVVAPSTGNKDTLGDQLHAQLSPLAALGREYWPWLVGVGVVIALYVFREPLGALARKAVPRG